MKVKKGRIIIPDGISVWPHELETAKVLIRYGFTVEFIRPIDRPGKHSADCLINGVRWEMKSPRASNIKAVERNLKRGKWQASRIIFDSRRMKGIPDKAIERELRNRFQDIREIKQIIFVSRKREIVDIS